jgi:hypothetical protein
MPINSARFLSLVGDRQYQVRVTARAHAIAAEKFERNSQFLGVPVIILMTIVGTSSFGSLVTMGKSFWVLLIAGILSMTSAVLTALQTFFNFNSKAVKHAETAARLNALAFRFDVLWRMRDDEKFVKEIGIADAEMNSILLAAPRVSMKFQKMAKEAIDGEKAALPPAIDEENKPRREGSSYVFLSPG